MGLSVPRYQTVAAVFWVCACITIVAWASVPGYVVGWDLNVYKAALTSLKGGHDPYLDGIAIQRVFHSTLAQHPNAPTPFTYVYSPLTLPVVAFAGRFPLWLSGAVYWLLYAFGIVGSLWVAWQMLMPDERRPFYLMTPAAVFFPGLLQNDVLFCGNVAIFLHGIVLLTALYGWRRNRWISFYLVVLLASCFKAPLLSLLAIPVLSARKQWVPTLLTGAVGIGLFAMQPYIWPDRFYHYLEAVELQFSFNHDFSSSPAGLLAGALYDVIPYRVTSLWFYLFYAVLLSGILLYLSRLYFVGAFSLKRWVPTLMVGVVLLNPRIMEYDVFPITLLMALVAWRLFKRSGSFGNTIALMVAFFVGINGWSALAWRPTECLLLVGLFAGGVTDLLLDARVWRRQNATSLRAIAQVTAA